MMSRRGWSDDYFAVYGNAPVYNPTTSIFNVAIYGDAPVNTPATWIPPANTGTWAGYFNGDLGFTGKFGSPSDSTIKTSITSLKNISQLLDQINCYSYYFDSTKYGDHIKLPKDLQYGFFAQEVVNVFPGIVMNGSLPPKIDSTGNVLVPA